MSVRTRIRGHRWFDQPHWIYSRDNLISVMLKAWRNGRLNIPIIGGREP